MKYVKVPNPDSAAAKSDLISEDPLMKKTQILIIIICNTIYFI